MSVRDRVRNGRPQPLPVDTSLGRFWVLPMNGRRRDAYIQRLLAKDRRPLTQSEIAAWGMWDEEAERLAYDPANADDVTELEELDGGALGVIVQRFLVASGIVEDPVGAAEKKSESSQSSDSGIALPSPSVAQ